MVQVHCTYKGRVQGVGFRYSVCRIAKQYPVSGWVKNLPDGSVEMLTQGEQKDIEKFCQTIKNYFADNISDVKEATQEVINPCKEFTIQY